MKKKIIIALAGNPNSGKSTIFNSLTGARQHVGNYPGVTVEKKEGYLKYKDYDIQVVDLPGIYSLTAYSIDEIVARNFILKEKPDIVIDIVDSSNIERNLYLSTQLMELDIPIIIALNMYDIAKKRGTIIDKDRLSKLLGIPLVFTIGTKNRGINELLDKAIEIKEESYNIEPFKINYDKEIETEINNLMKSIPENWEEKNNLPLKWTIIKLLEEDENIKKLFKDKDDFLKLLDKSIHKLCDIYGESPSSVIPDKRYGFISGACTETVKFNYEIRHSISDKIDIVLLNRILGIPIFLFLMYLAFKITFSASAPLVSMIEKGQELLEIFIGNLIPTDSIFHSLAINGIIGGVGAVLIFVPIIFLLFLVMAILEDSGYMARVAFIMDKLMHKIGLHGRSFIPMLLGFGCNLPAILSTRTIEDKKDRFVTILVNPFISCGARLPVYILFIGAFFRESISANILFSLYLIGIIIAIIMAKIFRKFLFKGEAAPFVMELPPYRIPTIKGLILHMWERGFLYIKKAGTVIFVSAIFIWFLSNFPFNPQLSKDYDNLIVEAGDNEELINKLETQQAYEKSEKSLAATLGKFITPVLKPIGVKDWKLTVGLIGGFIAKEIVVSTLGTLHSVSEADEESQTLRNALLTVQDEHGNKLYSPLSAYSIMIFVLLYIPCAAVVAVIKKETNSWRWPIFTIIYTTAIAYIISFSIYQIGSLIWS